MMRKCLQRRPYVVLILSTLIILLGGAITLVLQMQQHQGIRADGGNVVGPPTLPASTVNSIFARMGSPMAGTGQVVEQASRQTNIDDAFALAVWWAETNDGAAGVGLADRNPGSVRGSAGYPSAYDGYTIYPSYSAAITDWFNVLKNRYIDRGLTTIYAICYPYVGTSGASSWAAKVSTLMLRYQGEAPPPPTPTPVQPTTIPPTPTPTRAVVHTEVKTPAQSRDITMPEIPITRHHQQSNQPTQQQQSSTAPALAASNQPLFIGLGILLAIAITFLIIKRRKSTYPTRPVPDAMQPARYIDPITPPPLFVNEYSPIGNQETSSLLLKEWTEEIQLEFPTQPVSQALVSNSEQPRPARTEKRLRRRRLVQLPSEESSTEQIAAISTEVEEKHEPKTEALSYRIGTVTLPDRVLEPVSASSGGLLSRYGNKKPG